MAQAIETAGEILVLAGTKDGVYLLRSDGRREAWRLSGPSLVRHDVCHVVRDRCGTLWAAANPRDGAGHLPFRGRGRDLAAMRRTSRMRTRLARPPGSLGREWAGLGGSHARHAAALR